LDYKQLFIFPDHVKVTYVGVTHECPHASHITMFDVQGKEIKEEKYDEGFDRPLTFEGVGIKDFNDGGCKSDKFVRDVHSLGAHIARPCFYLAISLQKNEQYFRAMEWFEKRVELGGFHEECFKAMLGIAECQDAIFRKVHVEGFAPPDVLNAAKIFMLAQGTPEERNILVHKIQELDPNRKIAEKKNIRLHLGDGDPATTDLGPIPTVHEVMMAYLRAAEYRPSRAFEAYAKLFKFFRETGQDVNFFLRKIIIDAATTNWPREISEIIFSERECWIIPKRPYAKWSTMSNATLNVFNNKKIFFSHSSWVYPFFLFHIYKNKKK